MSEKFKRASDLGRVPPPSGGLNVNFCKNTLCDNFGIPEVPTPEVTSDTPPQNSSGRYVLADKSAKITRLRCKACNKTFTTKNNEAIQQEYKRISGYLHKLEESSCPNPWCANSKIGISAGTSHYYSHSKTTGKSRRYKCRSCGKVFSVKRATHRQKESHKNPAVFRDLVTLGSINAICEKHDIWASSLYYKIDFFYKRCLEFMGTRERRLLKGFPLKRIELSIDQQQYRVNWSNRKDRRNTMLQAIGAADNISGYLFPMALNFDPRYDIETVEQYAIRNGDYDMPYAFRKYARLWLPKDYVDSVYRNELNKAVEKNIPVEERIKLMDQYNERLADTDAADAHDETTMLPIKGMQIHSQYTIFGYFKFLHELFQHVEKVRIYMDQDSGFENACLSMFHEEISKGTCDAFFVQVNTNYSNPLKMELVKQSNKLIRHYKKQAPGLSDHELRAVIIKDRLKDMVWINNLDWLIFPFSTMYEPEKAVAHLTPRKTDYEPSNRDHLARMFNRASMHALDSFFDSVRYRLSPLRRAHISQSNKGKTYAGYGAYNPDLITKLLTILRFYYNYVRFPRKYKKKKASQRSVKPDGTTPAMRLGLAEGPVVLKDLFSGRDFSDSPETIKKSKLEKFSRHVKRSKGTIKPLPEINLEMDMILRPVEFYQLAEWDGETVFIDMETTGLHETDRVIEIAIVSEKGEVLMNTLINPGIKIPQDVAAISHKITDEMVRAKLTYKELELDIIHHISGKRVVSYNIEFESQFFTEAMKKEIGLAECCMRRFAHYYKYFASHKRKRVAVKKSQKLVVAAEFVKHKWNGPQHRALADAMACRDVWLFLDKQEALMKKLDN